MHDCYNKRKKKCTLILIFPHFFYRTSLFISKGIEKKLHYDHYRSQPDTTEQTFHKK